MSDLLNESSRTETVTTYDRSHSGHFDNPYEGAPSLTFNMQRVTFQNSDDKLLSAESLPNVTEPYSPGKVYPLYNPQTGDVIPGVTFTPEQLYAMIYSTMRRAVAYADAVRTAAAASMTLVAASTALDRAQTALAAAQTELAMAELAAASDPSAAAVVAAAEGAVAERQAAATAALAARDAASAAVAAAEATRDAL